MALIVGIATVVGASATIAGVFVALRGQRRSASTGADGALVSYEQDLAISIIERFKACELSPESPPTTRANTLVDVMFDEYNRRRDAGYAIDQHLLVEELDRRLARDPSTKAFSFGVSKRTRSLRGAARRARAEVPGWATGLMSAEDARRYTAEWHAHLYQLVAEDELRQARRDRRALALTAVCLAVTLRLRRVLSSAR